MAKDALMVYLTQSYSDYTYLFSAQGSHFVPVNRVLFLVVNDPVEDLRLMSFAPKVLARQEALIDIL